MTAVLDHRQLYRLPWNLTDNAIAWLEPTMKCNLACEGCYRANINQRDPFGGLQGWATHSSWLGRRMRRPDSGGGGTRCRTERTLEAELH